MAFPELVVRALRQPIDLIGFDLVGRLPTSAGSGKNVVDIVN